MQRSTWVVNYANKLCKNVTDPTHRCTCTWAFPNEKGILYTGLHVWKQHARLNMPN